MSQGVVVGGWEYVWLAYVATGLALGGYAVSVCLRYLTEWKRLQREDDRAGEGTR